MKRKASTGKKKPPVTKKATAASQKQPRREEPPEGDGDGHWRLRLYVAGETARSLTAFVNLKKICDQHLPGRHTIEVVDLSKNPELAQNDQIVALPTLVRKLPEPIRRIIGDLSNLDRVLVGMDLKS